MRQTGHPDPLHRIADQGDGGKAHGILCAQYPQPQSAIVVQGLANDTLKGNIASSLVKETILALINGLSIAFIVLIFSHLFFETSYLESISIGIAVVVVILIAALIGTFVPMLLDKKGVDPAVATGPFITTSNDVFGILVYFLIAKIILGF